MLAMTAGEGQTIFLSCFKCGRIVSSKDMECPRCGLQFGAGTLFECPFCSGLIWRNATKCSSCGINLTEFSESVLRTSSGFDMDAFVDNIINTELEQLKSTIRRVACPGCGLMIRGDEDKCPRCDLPLEEALVDCPVCGEKIPIAAKSCASCQAVFEELPEVEEPIEAVTDLGVEELEVSAEEDEASAVREKSRARDKKPSRAHKKPTPKPKKRGGTKKTKAKTAGTKRRTGTKKSRKGGKSGK